MASEAGKLIAVSLGKIADSRKQRGGINLCKNLLVSTVLFKARSIYMMENYQQIAEAKKQKREAKCGPKSLETSQEIKLESQSERVDSSDLLTQPSVDLNTSRIPESDKENIVPHRVMNTQTSQNDTSEKMEYNLKEKDSNSVTDEKLSEISDNTTCGRCTKRRRSELSGDNGVSVEQKSRVDESGLAKKARIESEQVTNSDIDTHCEPMVTETPQISNLVQIFNTGFAGLCEQQAKDSSYSSQSCVKQVASFVESLSRPGIALAV